MEEKKRLSKLENIASRLKRGENVQNRQLWSRFALPIFYRILQTLLISTPKTIHNIELKLDIISKINLRNGDSYDEYSKFIIREVSVD